MKKRLLSVLLSAVMIGTIAGTAMPVMADDKEDIRVAGVVYLEDQFMKLMLAGYEAAADEAGVDYVGIGPFRFTTTKKNLSPVLGLEGYTSILSQMEKEGITLPVVAIGGITFEDIPDIMKTGVNAIALSGTILRAENPIEETNRILSINF